MAGSDERGRRPRVVTEQTSLFLPLAVASESADPILQPEEPLPCDGAFDAPDWLFTVDWDGVRVLAALDGAGGARIRDERGTDISVSVPEVVAAAPAAFGGRRALVEGTLAVLDAHGCPDLGAVLDRLHGGAAVGAPTGPVPVLLVTDLLAIDGAGILDWPLRRRLDALWSAYEPAPHVQFPELIAEHGRELCRVAGEHGLGAVLARQDGAPYRPGTVSPHRLRIDLDMRAEAVVIGVVQARRGDVEALLLAEYERDALVDAGQTAVSISDVSARWLRARVAALRVPKPCVDGLDAGPDVRWVRPSLVASLRHHGRTADRRFRLPTPLGVREDRPARGCVRRQPSPAPRAGSAAATGRRHGPRSAARRVFLPTILRPLPLDGPD